MINKTDAIYARYSSHAQDEGTSIDVQLEQCERSAGGRCAHYIDRAKTGRATVRARFKQIAKSFSSFIPEFKKPKIKMALVSFLSAAFAQFGGIDSPELRKLFDNYANSKSQGKALADPDLPRGLDAFSKAIRRGRQEWAVNRRVKTLR